MKITKGTNRLNSEADKSRKNENELVYLPDGRRVAIDRSVGVVLLCLTEHKGKLFVLANRRGDRTSEFKEKWNLPSGYLNWNESGEEAAVRETFEETGLKVPVESVFLVEASTKPTENRQNVIFRYAALLPEGYLQNELSDRNSEEREVSAIEWIDMETIDQYDWAFGHDETIKRMVSQIR